MCVAWIVIQTFLIQAWLILVYLGNSLAKSKEETSAQQNEYIRKLNLFIAIIASYENATQLHN